MRLKLRAPTDEIYEWLTREVLCKVPVYAKNPQRRLISTGALPSLVAEKVVVSGTSIAPEVSYDADHCATCDTTLAKIYCSEAQIDGQQAYVCQGKTCPRCNYPIPLPSVPPAPLLDYLPELMPLLSILGAVVAFSLLVAIVHYWRR